MYRKNCKLEGIIENEKVEIVLKFLELNNKIIVPKIYGEKMLGIGKRLCDGCEDSILYGFTRYCKNERVIIKYLMEK